MKKKNSRPKPDYPLFKIFTLDYLAENTGYNYQTLMQYKEGYKRVTKLFRHKMTKTLKRSEEELFGGYGR
jgi:hypothetical protein